MAEWPPAALSFTIFAEGEFDCLDTSVNGHLFGNPTIFVCSLDKADCDPIAVAVHEKTSSPAKVTHSLVLHMVRLSLSLAERSPSPPCMTRLLARE